MRRLRWSSPILLAVASLGFGRIALADDVPPLIPGNDAPAATPADAPPVPPPPPVEVAPPAAAVAPSAPFAVAAPLAAPAAMLPTATAGKIEAPFATMKIGVLLQPQYESVGSTTINSSTQNLFLRRMRLMLTGTLFGDVDYFVLTDFPNLGKTANVGTAAMPVYAKLTPGMNIQDAFATYHPIGDPLKIDVGYMLPPMSHNSLQGAGTMLGWDYFAYTFQHTNSFGTQNPPGPVGRDVGVQLRGLVLDGHLEYRAGIFQGLRDQATPTASASRNFFRVTARVQINLLDPETGFFYGGTYFGAKKVASIGGSYDFQDNYKYFSVDGLLDMPVGPGIVTGQAMFARWDGGTFITGLPKQTAIVGEAGYTIVAAKVSPIVRYEHLSGNAPIETTSRYAGGLAYWMYGHTSNLKVFFTRIQIENAPHGANQINVQWQVYFL